MKKLAIVILAVLLIPVVSFAGTDSITLEDSYLCPDGYDLILKHEKGYSFFDCEKKEAEKPIPKEPDVKYEVTISIKYNAISPEQADKITSDARRRYGDACKFEINIVKADENNYNLYIGDAIGVTPTLPDNSEFLIER